MFEAHCDYSIKVDGNMMLCTMQGAWNVEGTVEYFESVKQHAQTLIQSPWGRIVDTTHFDAGPIEIMQILIDIQKWSLEHNCQLLVIVGSKTLNRDIIEKNKHQYPKMALANTMEEAIEQIKQCLED